MGDDLRHQLVSSDGRRPEDQWLCTRRCRHSVSPNRRVESPRSSHSEFGRKDSDRIEKRIGTVGAALLVGLVLLLAGAVYVMPAAHCINHGCGYQEIATDPWHVSNSNPLRMRLLTPLLAYALGFRHERYIAFPMALVGVFLAQVYMYVRKQAGCSPLTALAVSTALATTTLLAHSLHHSGVQDPMQYCLLVAALANAGNPIIAPLAVGLGVMSHESTMFHVPWVTIAIWRERRSLSSFVTACVTMLVLIWIVFRIRVGIASAGGTLYTEQAYLSISNVIHVVHDIALLFPLGTFMSLRAVWFVPLASAWVCWKGRHFLIYSSWPSSWVPRSPNCSSHGIHRGSFPWRFRPCLLEPES